MKRFLIFSLLALALSLQAQVADEPAEEDGKEVQTVPEGQVEDGGPLEEPVTADAADADFKPSEEISEDFPVPLPADI